MSDYAPVVVYTYTRLEHLKKTISALKANHLAPQSDIFVVSDAAKNPAAETQVKNIRDFVDSIDGFNSVNKVYRDRNLGAFHSIRLAENAILSDYGRVISLEDDIITSKNFLDYINAGLEYYKDCDQVLTVAGYCHPISVPDVYEFDSWISPWHCPWGYGTWKNKYNKIDLDSNPLDVITKNRNLLLAFKKSGDFILDTLELDKRGIISAADARICAQMFVSALCTIMPTKSKVSNIGNDGSGVHSAETNRFDVVLDEGSQRSFKFSDGVLDLDNTLTKQYLHFMNGGHFDRIRRKVLRILRRVEILRTIKNNVFSWIP